MHVRMNVPMGGVHPRSPGQVIEVSAEEGERLLAAHFAEPVEAATPDETGEEPKKSARKRQAPKVETATDESAETPED